MKHFTSCKQTYIRPNQKGTVYHSLLIGIILLFSIIGCFRLVESHAYAASPKIISGLDSYCLDDEDIQPDHQVGFSFP